MSTLTSTNYSLRGRDRLLIRLIAALSNDPGARVALPAEPPAITANLLRSLSRVYFDVEHSFVWNGKPEDNPLEAARWALGEELER